MLTLHHLSQSRSFRILWLLEELKLAYGLPYQLISHDRDTRTFLAPKAFASQHTMGKAPILIDDSLPVGKQALAESAFIIEYLLKYHDAEQRFLPHDDASWRQYAYWLHFSEGTLMPPLVMGLILNKAIGKSPFFVKPIVKKLKAGIDQAVLSKNITSSLTLIDNTLSRQTWLAGEHLTGADIQMHFALAALHAKNALAQYPAIINWLTKCQQRPAFIQAEKLAGSVF